MSGCARPGITNRKIVCRVKRYAILVFEQSGLISGYYCKTYTPFARDSRYATGM